MTVKFLLIDDDYVSLRNLSNILKQSGMTKSVRTLTNPEMALEEIEFNKPDIIIIDFLMPVIDGVQLSREIHKHYPEIGIIMLSQVVNKNMIARAYEAGVKFYISKPINKIEVEQVVKRVYDMMDYERKFQALGEWFKGVEQPTEDTNDHYMKSVQHILSDVGIQGEKGSKDIVEVIEFLKENDLEFREHSFRDLTSKLYEDPKIIEQRIRRAIAKGLKNIAHLGLEDNMNENFVKYANSLYEFSQVKKEMDAIRGKTMKGGKVQVTKFFDNLTVLAERF